MEKIATQIIEERITQLKAGLADLGNQENVLTGQLENARANKIATIGAINELQKLLQPTTEPVESEPPPTPVETS